MSTTLSSSTPDLRWRNLRTGALVLIGIAIAVSLALVIGKNSSLLSHHDSATIFLHRVNGMSEGNMVTVSGKKIGVVQSIEFARRNDTSGVVITLDIVHEYFSLLTVDSKVIVRSMGILGDKYIDINLGSSTVLLADGGGLESFTEPGMEELTTSAIATMNTIEAISTKINNGEGSIGKLLTTTELHDRLLSAAVHVDALTSNLNAVSHEVLHGNGLLPVLLNDTAMKTHVVSLVANLNQVSASLAGGHGTLGKLIVDGTLYDRLDAVTKHADSLILKMNSPSGTLGKLMGEDGLYKRLDHSIMSLDSLLMDLKQNPGRYIKVSVF